MSWSKQGGRSGERGYHHGNLKEALIRAALELIAQKGPAGFTFAEAGQGNFFVNRFNGFLMSIFTGFWCNGNIQMDLAARFVFNLYSNTIIFLFLRH